MSAQTLILLSLCVPLIGAVLIALAAWPLILLARPHVCWLFEISRIAPEQHHMCAVVAPQVGDQLSQ